MRYAQSFRKFVSGGHRMSKLRTMWLSAARHAEAVDTTTSHVGFRCVIRGGKYE